MIDFAPALPNGQRSVVENTQCCERKVSSTHLFELLTGDTVRRRHSGDAGTEHLACLLNRCNGAAGELQAVAEHIVTAREYALDASFPFQRIAPALHCRCAMRMAAPNEVILDRTRQLQEYSSKCRLILATIDRIEAATAKFAGFCRG